MAGARALHLLQSGMASQRIADPGLAHADTDALRTEASHPQHGNLDEYDTGTLVLAFVDDQAQAVAAVRAAGPSLARAVDAAVRRLQAGGRLVYVGAGTSGRLGVLDSVELLPTFSWPTYRAVGVLAGGPRAMFVAVEGAEDEFDRAQGDLQAAAVDARDVVLLIAASGTTQYTLGAAHAAAAAGALTVGLCNNADVPLLRAVEHPILLDTGPEVISGSTRLKAGTAQKIALNAFSSSVMVRLNKVYGNLMVDLKAGNAKLRQRALRLTMSASGADAAAAESALVASAGHVKTAIVMLKTGTGVATAHALLEAHGGSVRRALGR
jgi:N-acetylmuramic acid 6-phosphate etherase